MAEMTISLSSGNGPLAQADALAAFGEFLGLHVADGDASEATLRTYKSNVQAFYQWATELGIHPAAATSEDLVSYRRALVDAKLSRATVTARLDAARRFFEAAVWRGLRADNPAAGLKAPRDKTAPEERIKFLPQDYLSRLLGACPAGPMGKRDRAVVALFCLQGPRVSEMAGLDVADVDLVSNPPTVRIRHGKGDKSRTLYLATVDTREIRAWLEIRPALALPDEAALFVTTQGNQEGAPGRRVSDRSLRRRIDALLLESGLKRDGVSCHSLRHSFGTWSAAAGVPVAAISATLGHADIKTTGVYVKVADRIKQNPAAALEKLLGLVS